MSVNIKQNGDLIRVANNVSIVQADWNDKDNITKGTCIKNQPDTLKTLDEIAANTDENALVGAAAVKELIENGIGENNIVYLTKAEYDALPDTKLTDGVEYRITDAGVRGSAENVSYDNSVSGLEAKNVQEAIDEVNESLVEIKNSGGLVGDAELIASVPANSDYELLTLNKPISEYSLLSFCCDLGGIVNCVTIPPSVFRQCNSTNNTVRPTYIETDNTVFLFGTYYVNDTTIMVRAVNNTGKIYGIK